ncbi:Bromodomain containing protein [Histomonas meleagridis]|uniref:Bromodomain containing protein n=1 Tax=Histomonas meleagridis TaxID=135588 RepID=UPI00355A3E64|nr:Bromodomain containing protein [Histomonas meleagridis]KAH0801333.1 Bromodomain containing protein [Histomonas meleagridis]
MNTLCARPLAEIFLHPVDPKDEEYANYYEVIKDPIDLTTIKTNLEKNKYKTILEWKNDVEKVWNNSLLFHKNNDLVRIITLDLKHFFAEISKAIAETSVDCWKLKLIQLHQELLVCGREMIKCRPASGQKAKPIIKRDQLTPIIEDLPPPQFRRYFKSFTPEELIELTNSLNSLKESQVQKILSILKEQEPGFMSCSSSNELNINLLKPSTLSILKEQLDEVLQS